MLFKLATRNTLKILEKYRNNVNEDNRWSLILIRLFWLTGVIQQLWGEGLQALMDIIDEIILILYLLREEINSI